MLKYLCLVKKNINVQLFSFISFDTGDQLVLKRVLHYDLFKFHYSEIFE